MDLVSAWERSLGRRRFPNHTGQIFNAFFTTKEHGTGMGFVSAERSSRPMVVGCGLRRTSRAEQVFISCWLCLRTPRAWTPGTTA